MKFKTLLLVPNAAVLIVLVLIGAVMFNTTRALQDSARLVAHTEEVIGDAEGIAKLVVDLETGQRGFLLTGDETFDLVHSRPALSSKTRNPRNSSSTG